MLQVNLSALNGQELRQILDASRRRGDAALSYKVLQEMAARRDAAVKGHPFKTRRPTEPHLVTVEFDEPEASEEPPPLSDWRPSAQQPEGMAFRAMAHETAEAAPAEYTEIGPPTSLETDRPLTLGFADPEPPDEAVEAPDLGLRPQGAKSSPPRQRRGLPTVAGFALGVLVGTGLGWWASQIARDTLAPPPAPAPAQAQVATLMPQLPSAAAAVTPSAVEPAPAAEAPAQAGAQETANGADSQAIEPPPPPPPPPPLEADAESPRLTAAAPPVPGHSLAAATKGCDAEPTPADREICAVPELRRLQGELRQAYAEALAAHEDRELLRQRQLAWRDARDAVSDPDQLVRLYEARIRKLNAAAQAAREQR